MRMKDKQWITTKWLSAKSQADESGTQLQYKFSFSIIHVTYDVTQTFHIKYQQRCSMFIKTASGIITELLKKPIANDSEFTLNC